MVGIITIRVEVSSPFFCSSVKFSTLREKESGWTSVYFLTSVELELNFSAVQWLQCHTASYYSCCMATWGGGGGTHHQLFLPIFPLNCPTVLLFYCQAKANHKQPVTMCLSLFLLLFQYHSSWRNTHTHIHTQDHRRDLGSF